MKIGMVTACYKPVINGVTRMVALYTEHLRARGHEVTIFTLGDPDPAGDDPWVLRSPGAPLGRTGYYFAARYTREAQAALRQMEIVHCHHLVMSVELAHRYAECPILYTNHTRYDLYATYVAHVPPAAAELLMRQAWPEFTDRADWVIAPSPAIQEVLLQYGVQRPISVIENGVPLERYRVAPDPALRAALGLTDAHCVALYVGRLAEEKRVELLLRQFARAHRRVPTLRLVIVGGGPAAADLQAAVAAAGLQDAVRLIGPQPFERVARYLAIADLFVTASISEVHPLTVIEALAAGLPVAAYASPGIADTIASGREGLLADAQQPDTLGEALAELAADPAQRRAMAQAARQTAERFDIAHTIDRTLGLYQRLRRERPDLRREDAHGRWRRLLSSSA